MKWLKHGLRRMRIYGVNGCLNHGKLIELKGPRTARPFHFNVDIRIIHIIYRGHLTRQFNWIVVQAVVYGQNDGIGC
jgi:hypothetical protein